jgi:hypothetical protein
MNVDTGWCACSRLDQLNCSNLTQFISRSANSSLIPILDYLQFVVYTRAGLLFKSHYQSTTLQVEARGRSRAASLGRS